MQTEEEKSQANASERSRHIPVLLDETMALLNVRHDRTYIDATAGAGGHLKRICELKGTGAGVIALDQDLSALERLRQDQTISESGAKLVHANFGMLTQTLGELGINTVDGGILADIGVSSDQLETGVRGFSFMRDGPLDMRMDVNNSSSPTAYDLINNLSESDLSDIIYQYGEERRSRLISRAIVNNRPIDSTLMLVKVIETALKGKLMQAERKPGGGKPNINSATKTFQALRIAVNSELDNLKQFLEQASKLLSPGARLVIITFHSLEDRMVKQFFKEMASSCVCPPRQPICTCKKKPEFLIITRKPLIASQKEVLANIRSRSAKLRAVEKLP